MRRQKARKSLLWSQTKTISSEYEQISSDEDVNVGGITIPHNDESRATRVDGKEECDRSEYTPRSAPPPLTWHLTTKKIKNSVTEKKD